MIFPESFTRGVNVDNPWWSGKHFENIPEFKRSDFTHYANELNQNHVNVLIGPRRVGKTVLIKQLIEHLITDQKKDPARIFFISLDRTYYELLDRKLKDAITFFEENILGEPLESITEPVYLFIDEAHFDKGWQRIMKHYVDMELPLYAIVSGSSAPSMFEDPESGAGRFHRHWMVTMKFKDVMRFLFPEKEKEIVELSDMFQGAMIESFKRKSITPYQAAIAKSQKLDPKLRQALRIGIEKYLLMGGYPEFYRKRKERKWEDMSRFYQVNVFDVILQKDVVTISNIRQPLKIRSLLVFLCQYTAYQIAVPKLAQRFNFSNQVTITQYIEALSVAFLLRTAKRFAKNNYPSTSPKKYYAADTGLRNAILGVTKIENPEERGRLLETAIFNHCFRLLFHIDRRERSEGYYWESDEGELDILLNLIDRYGILIPIEVKNGSCNAIEMKKMRITQNKTKAPFGIVVCNNEAGVKGTTAFVSEWMFLLSC